MRWWIVTLCLAAAARPAVGLAAGGTQVATAPLPAAGAVINAVLAAPTLVDYQGTKVVTAVRGDRAETVTMLESYKRSGQLRLEFLAPESVNGRLMVDDGASVWQYEPSLHLVVRGPLAQVARGADRLAQLIRRYTVSVLGTEEVIGRDAAVLELLPITEGAVRRFWVDQSTGVILRTEERDLRGEILFSSFFTRISYSLNLPSALFRFHFPAGARVFSLYLSGDPLPTPQALQRDARFSVVVPPRLPFGHRFRDGAVTRYGAFGAAAAAYTDGVSVLTIFQTPSSRMAVPQVGTLVQLRTGHGRLLDLGHFRVLTWQARGLNFAVVGTLPAPALTAIADELNAQSR